MVCWKEKHNTLREPWNMLWKFPLLPQYSAVSSVVFERNYKLVIKITVFWNVLLSYVGGTNILRELTVFILGGMSCRFLYNVSAHLPNCAVRNNVTSILKAERAHL
jgi:hypothetical protein